LSVKDVHYKQLFVINHKRKTFDLSNGGTINMKQYIEKERMEELLTYIKELKKENKEVRERNIHLSQDNAVLEQIVLNYRGKEK